MDSDCDLIRGSLAQPRLVAPIFDRHFESVFWFCLRRVGDSGAEDAAGETFRRAFEHRARYDCRSAKALPWLYGIALNVVRNTYRSSERLRVAVGRLSTHGEEEISDEVVSRVDAPGDLALVAAVIGWLKLEDREALLTSWWRGSPFRHVAPSCRPV